jgi:predicted P-loop ATPase
MIPSWLDKYQQRGFRLVFYEKGSKGPHGPAAVGWTARNDKPEDYIEGQNVGIFTGVEITPGKFLADVDFDWADGLALRDLLPLTNFGFGRQSRIVSHAFYTTPDPIPSKEYKDVDGTMFVELRSAKTDGMIGLQTMAAPSIHPCDEQVELRADGEIGHAENLPRRVVLYAIGCMLLSRLGQKGLLHEQRLNVAGFLLGEGLEEEEVIELGQVLAKATGNDASDIAPAVRSTAAKLRTKGHVAGKNALAKAIGTDGREVVARIKEWLGTAEWLVDKNGVPLHSHQENIRRAFEKLGVTLSFNDFAQTYRLVYKDFDDATNDQILNHIRLETQTQFNFLPLKDPFEVVVNDVAWGNKFHPVLNYLNPLTWDGISRLDGWLIMSAGAADTPYVKAISSMTLIAAVRRVRHPGCKFDTMLVLETGDQGLKKSTAVRALCPDERWFSDDLPLNVNSQELIERTNGKWIIEASDLSGMPQAQVERLKSMLSRQWDGPVRMAYAHIPKERPRHFILIGTTNAQIYLQDSTGGRRFWPVQIERSDIEWIRANRDQLWAEASQREADGEQIWLPPDLDAHAELQQERRRDADPWETDLAMAYPEMYQRLTPGFVYEALKVSTDRITEVMGKRVAKIMQRLGFRRGTVVVPGTEMRVWGWVRGKKLPGMDGLYAEEEEK